MLKDITVGQYIYGKSPLHCMEAWVKILLTIAYAAVLFFIKTPLAYAVYTVFTAVVIRISNVPLKMLVRGLRPLIPIFIATAFFDLFFTEGQTLVSLWHIRVTAEGIANTAQTALRLVLLIFGCSLLTLTTTPLALTDGIEKLLSPLSLIRVPVSDIAMMMSIALRFIPTIAEEADRLIKAQKARGADMESGGVIRRAMAIMPIIVPLLAGVFRRADVLASAMDARCYGFGRRTRMKETHAGRLDALAAAVFAAAAAAAIVV